MVGSFWILDRDLWEAIMLIYLAVVSIVALAATYEAKSKAAEAKAAGYENP